MSGNQDIISILLLWALVIKRQSMFSSSCHTAEKTYSLCANMLCLLADSSAAKEISKKECIQSIQLLLFYRNPEVYLCCAYSLYKIACEEDTRMRLIEENVPHIIYQIVTTINENADILRCSATTLRFLSHIENYQPKMVAQGAVEALICIVNKSSDEIVKRDCAEALESLSTTCHDISSGAVYAIIQMAGPNPTSSSKSDLKQSTDIEIQRPMLISTGSTPTKNMVEDIKSDEMSFVSPPKYPLSETQSASILMQEPTMSIDSMLKILLKEEEPNRNPKEENTSKQSKSKNTSKRTSILETFDSGFENIIHFPKIDPLDIGLSFIEDPLSEGTLALDVVKIDETKEFEEPEEKKPLVKPSRTPASLSRHLTLRSMTPSGTTKIKKDDDTDLVKVARDTEPLFDNENSADNEKSNTVTRKTPLKRLSTQTEIRLAREGSEQRFDDSKSTANIPDQNILKSERKHKEPEGLQKDLFTETISTTGEKDEERVIKLLTKIQNFRLWC